MDIQFDQFQIINTYTTVWLVLQFNTCKAKVGFISNTISCIETKKKKSSSALFSFSEKPFPGQLVFLRQQPFRSLESFAPSRNAIPNKSFAELQIFCRSCQMITSEKSMECKTYCFEILTSKKSAIKSGRKGLRTSRAMYILS